MNQIDQIKEILFSNEKRALDALTRRIEGRESRVADIADVLPEALGRSHANSEKISKALKQPVEEIFKDSVQKDPQGFADLLFPVMGPAIRKSITETLKEFTESINRAVEEQVSLKSLKWRSEARRAGVPYGQYLLQRNLEYRVDHAYLIQPNTGLLIADAHRPEAIRRDDEAVSAMLTAIQDFVKESFTTEEQSSLETADIGEYSLWVMQGPDAMLACVIFGIPPRSLREEFIEILERIHLQYGEQLEQFEGKQLSVVEPVLEECLISQAKQTEEVISKKKLGFTSLLGFLILAALLWFAWNRYQFNNKATDLVQMLEAQPGIVLTETDLSGGSLNLSGLRDSQAIMPESLIAASGLDPDKVSMSFTPFHSLEPEVIRQRIRSKLDIPEGIEMQLAESGELAFSGQITPLFKQQAIDALDGMLGVEKMTFGEVWYSDEVLLAEVIKQLRPPDSANLSVRDQILLVGGTGSLEFHKRLTELAPKIDGLNGLSMQKFRILEMSELQTLVEMVDGYVVMFSWRTRLTPAAEADLERFAEQLKRTGALLTAIEKEPEFILTGYTDDSGTVDINQDLQLERALYVKGRLVGLGVKPGWLFVNSGQNRANQNGVVNIDLRKVVVNVDTELGLENR